MNESALLPGRRVIVSELSETPLEGVESNVSIVAQAVPELTGETDVLVEVKSSSVGWVDLLMLSGQYQHMPPLPYTPGLEYSGVVRAVGASVQETDFAVGDRVYVDGFLTGPRSPGKYQQYGGFASYAIAPSKAIRKIPSTLDFDQACNLLGSYETAYHCLIKCGGLKSGETVLIHGASGATGMAAVHIAKLVGATVIATGRSQAKLDVVKAQGADYVINSCEDDGSVSRFRDEVKALTDGQGVDVVYDGVGGDISLESMRCVTFGARFLIVGWAATPFVAKGKGGRGAPNANMLPTNLIMMKGLQVLGCPTVISTQHDPSIRDQRLNQIFAWVDAGVLKPYVSVRYALDEVKDALKDKWQGKIIAGAVISH